MAVTYYDRAGWEYTLSQACSPVGDGQCDGYDYEDGGEACECACHGREVGSIRTVKQMARMHHLGWLFEGETVLRAGRVNWYNISD